MDTVLMDTVLMDIVLATANPGKVAELRALLGDRVNLVPRPLDVPDVVEDAGTYEGNVRLKATALCHATGLPALADDSGIEVVGLDNEPGVESAYFGGLGLDDVGRVAALLAATEHLVDRRARFVSVVMVVFPDGKEFSGRGTVEGQLARASRGPNGFGYDPIFEPEELDGRTFGEASSSEKALLSHRARAVRDLVMQHPWIFGDSVPTSP
jgi:XTP/dITP diphosphohydrolase